MKHPLQGPPAHPLGRIQHLSPTRDDITPLTNAVVPDTRPVDMDIAEPTVRAQIMISTAAVSHGTNVGRVGIRRIGFRHFPFTGSRKRMYQRCAVDPVYISVPAAVPYRPYADDWSGEPSLNRRALRFVNVLATTPACRFLNCRRCMRGLGLHLAGGAAAVAAGAQSVMRSAAPPCDPCLASRTRDGRIPENRRHSCRPAIPCPHRPHRCNSRECTRPGMHGLRRISPE